MNGAPITRTFREAALRAPPGSAVAFVEGEQANFAPGPPSDSEPARSRSRGPQKNLRR